MTIRPLSENEIQIVSDLADTIYPLEFYEPIEAFASRQKHYPAGAVGLFDDSIIVAYCFFHPWLGDDSVVPLGTVFTAMPNADCAYLHDLAVARVYRGRGMGNMLARHVVDQARAAGFKQCKLVSVLGSEPFWTKVGFSSEQAFSYSGLPATRMRLIF